MFTTNSGRFISYYGREHTLDIQRQDGNNPTISTIDQLFNVLLNVWCKETAYLHMAHPNGRVCGAKRPKCEAERSHHL